MPKLREYSAKRRFEATPEPAPTVPEAGAGPLLFVVQQHAARQLHYDFRLECDGVLLSWAVPKGPSLDPAQKRLAVFVEDHPFDYGSFEGAIPRGQYGAGEVIVWDCGVYSPDEGGVWFHDRAQAERRIREGMAAGKLSIQLRGTKLKGSFALVRTKDAKQWLLIKHKDRFVSSDDITAQSHSVLSGHAVEALRRVSVPRLPAERLAPRGELCPLPAKLEPMLAESVDAAFSDPRWLWEPKLDGYRALAFVDARGVRLRSRRGIDLTPAFPQLVADLRQQATQGMLLDGELVAFDAAGKPSFNALQNRVQAKTPRDIAAAEAATPTCYFAFDLLHFEGVDLRAAIYRDRRRYLAQCLMPTRLVQLVHAHEDGEALLEAALAAGFEGAMGKRVDSKYESGKRSKAWIKVKATHSAEFVVGGYTRGKGSRGALGAVLIGYWDKRKLRYVSHVGSGFDARSLKAMTERLAALRTETCPFAETPEVNGPVTWVAPQLVVEVEYQQWTEDERLRAPIFKALREDVDAKSVRRPNPGRGVRDSGPGKGAKPASRSRAEAASSSSPAIVGAEHDLLQQLDNPKNAFDLNIDGQRIKLTSLDRVYWPADPATRERALTKRDLLRYFVQVGKYMLPHLADRPLTMIRMPDGIGGQRFFQKHWTQAKPDFADTVTVFSEHKDERHEYLVCNNLPTLLWLAQSGTLEFHVWHSRAKLGPDAVSRSTDYASSLDAMDASVLNYPDYVVFDIDPYIYSGQEAKGEEPELNTVAFAKGKEIAFHLRELLNELQLEPIVKTSGKTGLHVFVPIERAFDFDQVRHVCELISRHLMRRHPQDVTMEWSVPKRTGKIFMDHNMNVRGKTLNVAYSPRGVAGAPVSMPLTWDELATAHPLDFRLTNVVKRLSRTGDRWRDALENKQDLALALKTSKA